MNIYVGNLSFETTEADLREAFQTYGEISSARIITDRETGRSRGFGFVEITNEESARKAIEGVNLKEIAGRSVTVNEARPKQDRSSNGGGGFRR